MPKGLPTPLDVRNRATKAAIDALRQGVPVNVIAAGHGLKGRTLHRWLQWNRDAFLARLEAIQTGRRFARVCDGNLTGKQLEFRKRQALARLSLNAHD